MFTQASSPAGSGGNAPVQDLNLMQSILLDLKNVMNKRPTGQSGATNSVTRLGKSAADTSRDKYVGDGMGRGG